MTKDRPTLHWKTVTERATEDLDPESADLKLPPGTDYTKPLKENR